MNKYLIATFIILMVFPKITLAHTQTAQIKMSEDGFEPLELRIHQNSQVEFINTDQTPRWPASDVHPLHSLYPEFDPKKAIEPGEVWKFKFQRAGQFKYHDHLLPHIKGTITVVSEGGQPPSSWRQNFKDFIQSFIFKIKSIFSPTKKDAAKSWEDLKQKYKGQAGSSGDIHDQAHRAGSLLYQEKGFLGIGICSPEFAFGCYHGFLDEAFKDDLSQLKDAQKACEKLGQGGPVASCIHGIGHGVASFYQTADLKKSLLSCENLTAGKQYCYDGVFMEFGRNAAPSFYKAENPLYPCNDVEARHVFSCGRNQPNVLMQRFNLSFTDVSDLCLNAQNSDFKLACFDSLGFMAAATSSGKADKILDSCNKIADVNFRAKCATAAAGELIFQDVSGWREEAPKVCNSLGDFKSDCTKYLQNLMTDYSRR